SSRRRHTRWPRDWSSDVCSSDLADSAAAKLYAVGGYASSSALGSGAGTVLESLSTGPGITLTATLGSAYLWSTGATTQSINVNATGNYTVQVTNNSGCAATSAPTSVSVNPLPFTPTATAGGSTTFCDGGSVTLTSSSASGNQWYQGGTAITGAMNQTDRKSVV